MHRSAIVALAFIVELVAGRAVAALVAEFVGRPSGGHGHEAYEGEDLAGFAADAWVDVCAGELEAVAVVVVHEADVDGGGCSDEAEEDGGDVHFDGDG